MIIAERLLMLRRDGGEIKIPIEIHAPEKVRAEWRCRFVIGWPDGKAKRWGSGSDAVQSLLIAMQMIGAEIYTSSHHEAGRLYWFSPGRGYGFPVTNNIRDLLVGDDKEFF